MDDLQLSVFDNLLGRPVRVETAHCGPNWIGAGVGAHDGAGSCGVIFGAAASSTLICQPLEVAAGGGAGGRWDAGDGS